MKNTNQFEKYEPVLKKFELEVNLNHNMYIINAEMSRKQALLTISPWHCRSKLSGSLQRHRSVFANLLIHPNLQVSLKSLALLLSLDKTLPDKVSHMMKICSNCVGLFYKLLHKMGKQDGKITGTRVISLDKNCWLSDPRAF